MAHSPLLVGEIRQRTHGWGSSKQVASDLGISPTRLCQIKGGAPIGKRTAADILAKIRAEDLDLADRIEAELIEGYRKDLRDERR